MLKVLPVTGSPVICVLQEAGGGRQTKWPASNRTSRVRCLDSGSAAVSESSGGRGCGGGLSPPRHLGPEHQNNTPSAAVFAKM